MKVAAQVMTLCLGVLFLATGCDTVTELAVPEVTYEAMSYGAKLHVSWSEVEGADRYVITVDGDTFSTPATGAALSGPAAKIEVKAVHGDVESEAWTLDCRALVTPSVGVWRTGGTENPNGFGFAEDGSCSPIDLASATSVDFAIEEQVFFGPMAYDPDLNGEDNRLFPSDTGDFDASQAAEMAVYSTTSPCVDGWVHYLWLDPSANKWDNTEDHFAKVRVDSIRGDTVWLRTAYQPVPGLLWLRTDPDE